MVALGKCEGRGRVCWASRVPGGHPETPNHRYPRLKMRRRLAAAGDAHGDISVKAGRYRGCAAAVNGTRISARRSPVWTLYRKLIVLLGLVFAVVSCMLGCRDQGPTIDTQSQGRSPVLSSDESYRRATEEGLARAQQIRERQLHNPRPERQPLPNFVAGPGIPRPIGVNFYEESDEYPKYLLCRYDVEDQHYDRANEPAWFKAALLQIRGSGSDSFPPFERVAVIIRNRAEHKGRSTFEESHKVGAIFDIAAVFDRTRDPARLVAEAVMDRHPFVFDPQRPTPVQQQRWTIVERALGKQRKMPK